jgi:hypothetical protein
MMNPGILVEALVAKLRAIPELVAEMNGEPRRIRAYHYRYPREASLARALYELDSPAVLVVWRGTEPGRFGRGGVWQHRFSLLVRSREIFDHEAATAGYYRIVELLINGIPAGGDGQRMVNTVIHESCYPMDLPRIIGSSDAEGLDVFELEVRLTEIGG